MDGLPDLKYFENVDDKLAAFSDDVKPEPEIEIQVAPTAAVVPVVKASNPPSPSKAS